MTGFLALAWFELKAYLKDAQAVFWTFAFPVLLVGVMVAIFDAGAAGPHGLDSYRFYLVTGVLSITVISNALFGFAAALSEARASGALVPYYLGPVPTPLACLAMMAARAVVLLLFAAVFLPASFAVLNVQTGAGPAAAIQLTAGLIGAACFAFALSLPLVWLARRTTAVNAIANIVNLYVLMTADAFFPISVVPAWGEAFITASPFYHLTQMLRAAFGDGQAGYVLLVAAGLLAAGLALAGLLARRRILVPPR